MFVVGSSTLAGRFEGSTVRPDLVFAWTTYKVAQEMINSEPIKNGELHWNELVSYVEVKKKIDSLTDAFTQTISYCHILPRAQPDIAGIQYGLLAPELLFLFWGDTSIVVRSHRFLENDNATRHILFRYVAMLVKTLREFPLRDATMILDRKNESHTIQRGDKSFENCKLISAISGKLRQTCVLLTEDSHRVVKDLWFYEGQRFEEADILKDIKDVPGVVQVDFSLDVINPITEKPLQTSDLHAGPDERSRLIRNAPCRTKKRGALKSTGKKMKTRKSVLQVVKGVHDSLRGTSIH